MSGKKIALIVIVIVGSLAICEEKDNSWLSPTSVGYVGYSIPKNPDEAILKEIDAIITSLSR